MTRFLLNIAYQNRELHETQYITKGMRTMDDRIFRGKRKDNGEWVKGYFLRKHDVPMIVEGNETHNIVPKTLGESINYTDVNGKEIFDGDICIVTLFDTHGRDTQYLCRVHFKYACAFFQILSTDELNDAWLISVIDIGIIESDVEVVGNIYDNPELFYGGENDE